MQEVLRLLAGANWPYLEVERRQQRVIGLCAVGVLALIFAAAAG